MTALARLAARLSRLVVALLALAVMLVLLVGVPWGLVTFIGWPLPDHIPSSNEIEATLLNPLSVTLLLDILACIAWPTWLLFIIDVARCVPDAIRGIHPPAVGPMHAVAGALVASALLGLPQPRLHGAASTGTAPPATPMPLVVTAQIDTTHTPTTVPSDPTDARIEQRTVLVRAPQAGIHDSLWRIAERSLGDGRRWVDLFQLNQGRPQPDGEVLRDPNLLQPGWVLQLPNDTVAAPAAAPQPAPQASPPPHTSASPSHTRPTQQPTQRRHESPTPTPIRTTSGTAISLRSGGLVAAALAGAVASAMVIRRRKRRRVYQPGSGDRTPPPAPAQAVHALRLAYDEDHLDRAEPAPVTVDSNYPQNEPICAFQTEAAGSSIEIGVHDGRARAIDLAQIQGLGVTGAGTEATARSLLVHLLGTTHATLIIPAEDARALLGDELPDSTRLHVTDDLDSAIHTLAEHTRTATDQPAGLTAVLVARISSPHPRLQSSLDTGSATGVAGILLGHWQAGATVRVRADGMVTAASPAIAELRGSRLFHLDATDTRDLLALLANTPSPNPPQPHTTDPATEEPGVVRDDEEDSAWFHLDYQRADHDDDERVDQQEARDREPTASPADFDNSAAPSQDNSDGVGKPEQPTVLEPIYQAEETSSQTTSNVPGLVSATGQTCAHPKAPWALSIFGPVTLTWYGPNGQETDVTSALAPKHKALLVFLALHPSGTTRAAIREALWSDIQGPRPFNAFYAGLSQIRKAFAQATGNQAADFIAVHDEQVALDPQMVEIDYWQLHHAEHDRRIAASDDERMTAWSRIAAVYRGEIAEGMSAIWLEGPREAAHRAVVDALAGMAAHYRSCDADRQLQLLEHARLLDPDNEAIYRDIMRAQAHLGYTDAIARTVQLLTTTLAEIGERPDPSTLSLARALQARQQRIAS